MPSTGTPSSKTACGARGAPPSYAEECPPDRITPRGAKLRTNASLTSKGWISQYTLLSRTRRAISCVYCAPKSRINTFSRTAAIGVCELVSAPTARTASPFTLHSLHSIIRRFLHDLHVVHMRFAHAGGGDLDELSALFHLRDVPAAHIAHRGTQTAHELLDN